jgi:hypothetical protein
MPADSVPAPGLNRAAYPRIPTNPRLAVEKCPAAAVVRANFARARPVTTMPENFTVRLLPHEYTFVFAYKMKMARKLL